MLCGLIGITGFAMLISTKNPHIQYAGTFLGAIGIYPCIANTISWIANNVEGVYKRGITMGFVIGWGVSYNFFSYLTPLLTFSPESQRYSFQQHLPRKGQAKIYFRTRGGFGLHGSLPSWRQHCSSPRIQN